MSRGDDQREGGLGVPLLERGQVALALLLDRREHVASAAPGQPGAADGLGRVEARRLGAAR